MSSNMRLVRGIKQRKSVVNKISGRSDCLSMVCTCWDDRSIVLKLLLRLAVSRQASIHLYFALFLRWWRRMLTDPKRCWETPHPVRILTDPPHSTVYQSPHSLPAVACSLPRFHSQWQRLCRRRTSNLDQSDSDFNGSRSKLPPPPLPSSSSSSLTRGPLFTGCASPTAQKVPFQEVFSVHHHLILAACWLLS